jgi:hypothetical protein
LAFAPSKLGGQLVTIATRCLHIIQLHQDIKLQRNLIVPNTGTLNYLWENLAAICRNSN